MFKNLLNKNKTQSGFTIIEVMIVLAIAGLILVVVLVAIPQLQRNQRNESRRSVASRIVTEINNYAGNNNGDLPIADTSDADPKNLATPNDATGFFGRYLGCTDADPADCSTNINDARTGEPVGTGEDGGDDITTEIVTDGGSELGSVAGSIAYATGLICDGEVPVDGSTRNFVFMMRLEGGAALCLDNR
jgi:prepilin-type N-terminal cleavage/methylation domain-containing protein